jgi:hypothetical protein
MWSCVPDKHVYGETLENGDFPVLLQETLRHAQETVKERIQLRESGADFLG